jgi:tetratricopeptide (TPR) repeat protein
MATVFAENYYSLRNPTSLIDATVVGSSPELATLAAIESGLAAAGAAYIARQYQIAIKAYQAIAGKIYALIDPSFLEPGGAGFTLPVDPALFQGLLSAASEYLNVLPVNTPTPAPRARIIITPGLISSMSLVDQAGISSAQVGTRTAVGALSDWQLAQNYDALGMTETAAFYQQRAQVADAALVAALTRPSAAAAVRISDAATTVSKPVGVGTDPVAPVTGSPTAPVLRPIGVISDPVLPVAEKPILPTPILEGRGAATMVAGKLAQFSWKAGDGPPIDTITSGVYAARIGLTMLPDSLLAPQLPSDVALSLPHDYYYVIPLALAQCYQALGDYAEAEKYYLQAAGYAYLNTAIEGPFLWIALANLYLDWGNSLFEAANPSAALPVYANVLTPDIKLPTSQLYTLSGLKAAWTVAGQVIASLATVTTLQVNPQIAAVIVDVQQQLIKIAGNLDFWGVWAPTVPIWTFDYLQQVAINFTQLAISAEQNVISFWNNADEATQTLQQLTDNVSQSQADLTAAQMQVAAMQAQTQVYSDGVTLANQRTTDATANATEYNSLSSQWVLHSALQAQMNGGDNGDSGALNGYASQMMAGNYDLSGSLATLAAAEGLTSARLNQQYEVDSMNRQAQEMQLAATQALDEVAASQAQQAAATAQANAATIRLQNAQGDVAAFNAQTFTPDVWSRMGDAMLKLYKRYFTMALKVARLMQQAYNFETDQSLALIKSSYASDEVNGLLGADALMADIQNFTYDLITTSTTKPQPVKQTISLAGRYGYLFESQFRKTGTMSFETTLDDFEMLYPGTYAGRIQTVEVAVQGIVPPTGLSGSLSNNGISTYRLPSANWTATNGGVKYRVQPAETLVLSDYSPRSDALVLSQMPDMLRIFEGAGVCSTWTLQFPPSENDLDYGALIDVQLTFSYEARFDPGLSAKVIAALAGRPGTASQQRGIPIRWVYPDAFFAFQQSGTMTISFAQRDFPYNQRSPVITSIGVVVGTVGGLAASGLTVALSTPAHAAAVTVATDANGVIDSTVASSPWAPLAAGTALGSYTIAVTAAANPALVQGGKLSLAGIGNIALVLGYSYTPRS